jgi:peptide/nickel transport system substrate-binding protein
MQGSATPATQLLPPPFVGHDTSISDNIYDPDRARALLAEAGYPSGFELVLSGPNDRYVNDALIAQAIASNLTRVGIKTTVDVMPGNVAIPRTSNREFGAFIIGAGQSTGEGTYGLGNLVASYDPNLGTGLSNHSRYSNPDLDRQIREASVTVDEAARTEMVQHIVREAMADVAFVPLHWEHTSWAMRKGVNYAGRIDQFNLATDVTFTQQ